MVLKKLKPEMTVYDIRPSTGLSVFNGRWNIWSIVIKEIDIEKNRVLASWSGNTPEWYGEPVWKKWRLKMPKNS